MIVVKLTGGLGNQMFQYATAFSLAKKIGVSLSYFHVSNLGETTRNLELDCFELSTGELDSKNRKDIELQEKIQQYFSLVFKTQLPFLWTFFIERSFRYDSKINFLDDSTVLSGYWQSHKYFLRYAKEIRNEFTFPALTDKKNKDFLQKIEKNNSVSIHIRRGDYVTSPTAASFHGTSSLDYYLDAISYIHKKVRDPVFFLFSDDIQWVKKNLKFLGIKIFISGNTGNIAYKDLQLMSSCKHTIMANSSFSWWGAWLNQNPKKIVIAPKIWSITGSIDTTDLLPNEWIKL